MLNHCTQVVKEITINKKPTGLTGHLSIKNSTLTSCQNRFAYQQTNHRINENQQWQRKALNTITLKVLHIDKWVKIEQVFCRMTFVKKPTLSPQVPCITGGYIDKNNMRHSNCLAVSYRGRENIFQKVTIPLWNETSVKGRTQCYSALVHLIFIDILAICMFEIFKIHISWCNVLNLCNCFSTEAF